MIEWLGEWLKDIILIVLLASFVDLLLPNSEVQRYARIILGLLIILVILTPIIEIFDSDYSKSILTNFFENEIYNEDSASTMQSYESIEEIGLEKYQDKVLEESTANIQKELSMILNSRMSIQIKDISLDAEVVEDVWQINKLIIYAIKTEEQTKKDSNIASNADDIKNVENVRVNDIDIVTGSSNKEAENDKENEIIKEIKKIIFEEWNITEDKIVVYLDLYTK